MKSPGLSSEPFDVAIIGGGINGAGIARDCAMRGLRVIILEKNDWGWGTSSKSSMLAHGGLRYLELFEFGLVHEALQERERLLRHAPHLVRPLRFLYPLYPHVAARRVMRVGMFLYDVLSHGKSLPSRQYLNKRGVLALVPGLVADGLIGGATYYDGQILRVERLVAEIVWDAQHHGADCRNHTKVTDIQLGEGKDPIHRLITSDGPVEARCIVNAAGAWVDQVLGDLAGDHPKVRTTKGVHVAVPRFTETALVIRATDGRTFFVLPWQDVTIIGTTDTDFDGDAGDAVATAEDVTYLLDSAREYLPDAPLDKILYTYAGVRALVNEEGLTESNVTRRHIIYDHGRKEKRPGLWSLQGGKITTYRALAEEMADTISTYLDRPTVAKNHPTRDANMPGGPTIPWNVFLPSATAAAEARYGIGNDSAAHIVATYGARYEHVLNCGSKTDLHRIHSGHPHLWCQVRYAVEHEDADTLADVMLRRMDLGVTADGSPELARRIAGRMATWKRWNAAEKANQLSDYERQSRVFAIPTSPEGKPGATT